MFKTIKNVKINYKQYGEGEDIVLLHGWGQNIQMMEPLGNNLKNKYRITIIDLPGFGLSNEPDYAYSVYDYTDSVHELLEELNVKKPTMIGHSFGGRLSIIYASKYPTNKVVLLASPWLVHEVKSKKQSLLKTVKKVKILKPLANVMKKYIGSQDYKNASPMMRDVLVKTVNEDLTQCVKKIEVPALLIWGESDTAVKVEDAKLLDETLKNSKLIIYPGTHYCYLEKLNEVTNDIINFL